MPKDSDILNRPDVCPLHEKYATRVNILWGMMFLMGSFIVAMGAAGGAMLMDTRNGQTEHVDEVAARMNTFVTESMQRDRELSERWTKQHNDLLKKIDKIEDTLSNDNNNIIRVLNVISINQKRVMQHLELEYMSPEWVRGYDEPD